MRARARRSLLDESSKFVSSRPHPRRGWATRPRRGLKSPSRRVSICNAHSVLDARWGGGPGVALDRVAIFADPGLSCVTLSACWCAAFVAFGGARRRRVDRTTTIPARSIRRPNIPPSAHIARPLPDGRGSVRRFNAAFIRNSGHTFVTGSSLGVRFAPNGVRLGLCVVSLAAPCVGPALPGVTPARPGTVPARRPSRRGVRRLRRRMRQSLRRVQRSRRRVRRRLRCTLFRNGCGASIGSVAAGMTDGMDRAGACDSRRATQWVASTQWHDCGVWRWDSLGGRIHQRFHSEWMEHARIGSFSRGAVIAPPRRTGY